uniref:NADH-ubiquinone oxidoreductase chain 6 n=1 Tax=Eulichas sp. BMNH 840452 TaxID=904164 RepID=E3VT69_9COLE|nr:NADH dehydrogenase subunit 6 [Eulichas sp. BMNH 840452]
MLTVMLLMSLMSSMMFLFLTHPMSMGMTLLMQTALISMITGFFNLNFWYSYILFLIMIGGMLVLFIYMTSIASNEMFKYSNKLTLSMITVMMAILLMLIMTDQMIAHQISINSEMIPMNIKEMFNLSLNKYLNYPSNIVLFFMIIYLFITLIAVVKITNISYGPLRQKL